jgi:hypothetical protein
MNRPTPVATRLVRASQPDDKALWLICHYVHPLKMMAISRWILDGGVQKTGEK